MRQAFLGMPERVSNAVLPTTPRLNLMSEEGEKSAE